MKALVLVALVALSACGGKVFPKCNDPTHPCPPCQGEPYPSPCSK